MRKLSAGDMSAIAFLTGLGLYELFIDKKLWVGCLALAMVVFLVFLNTLKK